MRAVVIQNQMHRKRRRDVRFDRPQECQELLAAMTPMQLANYPTSGHVQSCKQAGGAVALVVVRAPLGDAGSKRQHGLGAIQGLNLALLIDAQHYRLSRGIQVQPHNVAHFLDWYLGELRA